MSLQNAKLFIERVKTDEEFRDILDRIRSKQAFEDHLLQEGYKFTLHEFAETVNMLHVKCQFAEEADALMNVKNWYQLTLMSFPE